MDIRPLLLNDKLFIRFITLCVIGIIVLICMWYVSYYFLPIGLLRGANIAGYLAGNEASATLSRELIGIVSINIVSSVIIVIGNRYSIFLGYPLGYVIPLEWMAYYAILLGTNSFSIPMAHPMAPSLRVLQRSGIYEMAAYTLMATATYNLNGKFRRNIQWRRQCCGIIIAILILIVANYREASMIMEM
jgi:hypothetical protein